MYNAEGNTDNKNQAQAHMLARLMVVEQQLAIHDKTHDRIISTIDSLDDKLTDIKMQMAKNGDLTEVHQSISDIKNQLPDLNFMKKLGTAVLISSMSLIVGWILTSTFRKDIITPPSNVEQLSPDIKEKLDSILKKLEGGKLQ